MDSNWKNRFEHAEVTPSDALWANIEAGLDAGTSARPWIFTTVGIAATATLLFAASLVTYQFVSAPLFKPSSKQIVEATDSQEAPMQPKQEMSTGIENSTQEDNPAVKEETVKELNTVRTVEQNSSVAQVERTPGSDDAKPSSDGTQEINATSEETPVSNTPLEESSESIALIEDTLLVRENIAEVKHQPFEELPTLDDLIEKKERKNTRKSNRLWAGIFQGVGGFNSNISGKTDGATSTEGSTLSASGFSERQQAEMQQLDEKQLINTTLLVGVPVGEKLSVVSGVQYSKSSFSSSAVSANNELLHFTADSESLSSLDGATLEQTDLDGFYEMASIPIMMDYVIVSNQFRWSVQAGPSVGLMLRQKIMSEDLNLSQTSQPGDLYNPMHLRVVVGTSLSYELGEKYQVSLRPTAEQAITSITTGNASFRCRPFNYGISLGLLYRF